MNFVNFISNHGKRINRENQFSFTLYTGAKIDGLIQKEELEMLTGR
jgi:hypothetical protein